MSQLVLKGFLEMLLRDRKHKHVNTLEKDEGYRYVNEGNYLFSFEMMTEITLRRPEISLSDHSVIQRVLCQLSKKCVGLIVWENYAQWSVPQHSYQSFTL